MKKMFSILLLIIISLMVIFMASSCIGGRTDRNDVDEMNRLKAPVYIVGVYKTEYSTVVTVIDSCKKVQVFVNCAIALSLENYKKGERVK